jgi:hypothetical protein
MYVFNLEFALQKTISLLFNQIGVLIKRIGLPNLIRFFNRKISSLPQI